MSAPWLQRQLKSAKTNELSDEVRGIVTRRAKHHCECCGGTLFVGFQSHHHRRPSGMGGSSDAAAHTPQNVVHVCGRDNRTGCHGDIHQNPEQAREHGWLVRQGADPAKVPVLLWDGRPVLLDAAGGYEPYNEDGAA
jgi:hypothetical protein